MVFTKYHQIYLGIAQSFLIWSNRAEYEDERKQSILYIATLISADFVIPAKAGIQKKPCSPLAPPKVVKPGFPRIKYGAGLVKPGMTDCMKLMSSCITAKINKEELINGDYYRWPFSSGCSQA